MTQPDKAASANHGLGDEDIHAFGPPPAAAMAPRRRRWWPWLLLAALLGLLITAGLVSWLVQAAEPGWQGFYLDDEGWHGSATPLGALGAVLGLGLALLLAAVVVPLVLLGAALAVGLALALAAAGVATALLAVLAAVLLVPALLTAPLWGAALLLWWLLRPSRRASPAVASSATS
jgi:hypothetical protein